MSPPSRSTSAVALGVEGPPGAVMNAYIHGFSVPARLGLAGGPEASGRADGGRRRADLASWGSVCPAVGVRCARQLGVQVVSMGFLVQDDQPVIR